MRVMVFGKATEDSEKGVPPTAEVVGLVDVRLLRTAVLACSRVGERQNPPGQLLPARFDLGIGDGLLHRRRQLRRAPLPATSHGTELQRARFVPSGRWVDVNRDGALFSEPAQLVHSRGRNNHALPLNNDGFVFSADDVEVDVAFVGHGL